MDTLLSTAKETQTEFLKFRVHEKLKRAMDQRSVLTAVPIAEVFRRCAVLWVNGRLDDLLAEAPFLPLDPDQADP